MGDAADEHERIMINMSDELGLPPWATSTDFDFCGANELPVTRRPRRRLTDAEAQRLFDETRDT